MEVFRGVPRAAPFPLLGDRSVDLCHGAWLIHHRPARAHTVQHWHKLLDEVGTRKIAATLAMPGTVRSTDLRAWEGGAQVSRV